MINDLISRSDVIKIIKDEVKKKSSYVEHNVQIDILLRVKEIPIAYDVGKVLDELQEKTICPYPFNHPFIYTDKAEEIVKAGGIDG